MDLKNRDWLVRIQLEEPPVGSDVARAVEFSGLSIDFSIEKNLRNEPNKCQLTVYNLSPEHRRQIESMNLYDPKRQKGATRPKGNWSGKAPKQPKSGKIRVELEAGYVGARGLIFRGDLRRAITEVNNGTAATEISGEDGGTTILASRIRESFPAGVPFTVPVKACIAAMGLGVGNIFDVEDLLSSKKVSHGLTLQGVASDELTAITRRLGVRWSVQNGVMRFDRRDPRIARGYLLNQHTGMVGHPRRDKDGSIEVTSLLNPALQVGGYVTVESELQEFTGSYQIVECKYEGQSSGSSWYATLNLKSA